MASADKVISSVSLGRRQVSNIDLPRSQKLEEAYSSVATGLGNAEQHKIIAHTSGRTLSADTSAQSHQRTFIECSAAMGIEPKSPKSTVPNVLMIYKLQLSYVQNGPNRRGESQKVR
jgi:hypothetical protein